MATEQGETFEISESLFDEILNNGEICLSYLAFSEFVFSVNNEISDMVEMLDVLNHLLNSGRYIRKTS